jgi:DNA-binding response OmpR family regulator
MSEALKGKTILVVDDDPDIVTGVTACLEDTGATIASASDGNLAVSLAEQLDPDLVILDIMLPRKSGFLVLERLRQDRAKSEKPYVVMITGNQGQRHRQYAEALGVHGYINKPFAMDRLHELVVELLTKDDD